MQHIESEELLNFCKKIKSLLKSEGSFLVIDSVDAERIFYPNSEKFNKFFEELDLFCKKKGFSRENNKKVQEVSKEAGLDIVFQRKVYCSSTISNNKEVFSESYRLFFQIVKEQYGMKFDYDALNSDLEMWVHDNRSYCQIVLEGTIYQHR